MNSNASSPHERRRGIVAAPGLAIGPAVLFDGGSWSYTRHACHDPLAEIRKLEDAMQRARTELETIRQGLEAEQAFDQADVMDVQVLFLQDESLSGKAFSAIRESLNAESAWMDTIEEFARRIGSLPNPTLAERSADVRDVGHRVLSHLQGIPYQPQVRPDQPSIIIARDLTPSQTAVLDRTLVLGLCTAEGGPTSHTAIFARAFGLPALVGVGPDILELESGTMLILDAAAGELIIRPAPDTLAHFRGRAAQLSSTAARDAASARLPAISRDGRRIEIFANIGGLDGAHLAIQNGAEGVGLLRTEFIFLERDSLPDEDEQLGAYTAILDALGDRPVVLRTADIGGDKSLPYLELPRELNPFLGVRGLRLALAHPDQLLDPQLKAALRAGQGHDLRIMFPMVTTLDELRQARAALERCKARLLHDNQSFADSIRVGIMVEVPAAAIMAEVLAPEVDFFSIGTNDLTQYVMAADRTNAALAPMASAFSPAVLRLIDNVVRQAHKFGKPVGVCGELAGEPLAVPILFGLGVDELSMNPAAIPAAKRIIRSLQAADCQKLAAQVLGLASADEVRACVMKALPESAAG